MKHKNNKVRKKHGAAINHNRNKADHCKLLWFKFMYTVYTVSFVKYKLIYWKRFSNEWCSLPLAIQRATLVKACAFRP